MLLFQCNIILVRKTRRFVPIPFSKGPIGAGSLEEGLDVPRDGKEIGCSEGRVRVGRSVRGEAKLQAEWGIARPVWNVLASEDLLSV